MEEWLQKGVEDWKQNMAYKKEREQSQLEFEYRQAQKMEETTNERVDNAANEVEDGIAKFEASLKASGIEPEVTDEFATTNI
jgi:predicted  nucleic acid-binding Zn-ribbon protein